MSPEERYQRAAISANKNNCRDLDVMLIAMAEMDRAQGVRLRGRDLDDYRAALRRQTGVRT